MWRKRERSGKDKKLADGALMRRWLVVETGRRRKIHGDLDFCGFGSIGCQASNCVNMREMQILYARLRSEEGQFGCDRVSSTECLGLMIVGEEYKVWLNGRKFGEP